MNELKISKANALMAYKEGDDSFRKGIEKLFPEVDFEKECKDYYAEACAAVGFAPLTIDHFSIYPEQDRESAFASHQIDMIARHWNEGWEPDYSDDDQCKYYPYFIWNEDRAGGPGFSYPDYRYDRSVSRVGARHVYKTSDMAIRAGKELESIYNTFLKPR